MTEPHPARGDGHTVLVLPGKFATDFSTRQLRVWLSGLGYDVHGWGLGRNRGVSPALREALRARLQSLYSSSGHPISLIGWSLGGVFARGLTLHYPEMVRQVTTMGSPFALLDGKPSPLAGPLRRPSTAIYSPIDRVVPWQSCVQAEGVIAENISVNAPHTQLGTNPAALWVIADRLAQPIGFWRPFDAAQAPKLITEWLLASHI